MHHRRPQRDADKTDKQERSVHFTRTCTHNQIKSLICLDTALFVSMVWLHVRTRESQQHKGSILFGNLQSANLGAFFFLFSHFRALKYFQNLHKRPSLSLYFLFYICLRQQFFHSSLNVNQSRSLHSLSAKWHISTFRCFYSLKYEWT